MLPVFSLLLDYNITNLAANGYYSKVLLLNSGIIFVIGGLIAMSSSIFPSKIREYIFHSKETWSPEEHKKSEAKANLYLILGILLFIESILTAFSNL